MFISSKENPYHLSVGVALRNNQGEIACHHFDRYFTKNENLRDIYILMRESLEPKELIEDCIRRGLAEEFGAVAIVDRYLGSLVSHFTPSHGVTVEKTTIYFLAALESIDTTKRQASDPEASSEIVWLKPEVLIAKMEQQAIDYPTRTDLNESLIIKRVR